MFSVVWWCGWLVWVGWVLRFWWVVRLLVWFAGWCGASIELVGVWLLALCVAVCAIFVLCSAAGLIVACGLSVISVDFGMVYSVLSGFWLRV